MLKWKSIELFPTVHICFIILLYEHLDIFFLKPFLFPIIWNIFNPFVLGELKLQKITAPVLED